MDEKWKDDSFKRGMQIVSNKEESPISRALIMEKIHSNRLNLNHSQRRQLLENMTSLAKDGTEDPSISAQALHTMGNLALTMEEMGEASRAEATKEASFLLAIAVDRRKNDRLRGNAINAVGMLRIAEASPILRGMLSDGNMNVNVPEIARPSCLSLMRIDREGALPTLESVMQTTTDAAVFDTAAFAVGQIRSPESMRILARGISRFPDSDVAASMISEMEEITYDALKMPYGKYLTMAVISTRYMWRNEQREKYIPLLLAVAKNAGDPAKSAAIERLIERSSNLDLKSEKRELQAVLDAIDGQPDMEAHRARIRERLSAEILSPSGTASPTH